MARNKGFTAQYAGTCRRCQKAIEPGHRIVLFNKPYPKSPYHLNCQDVFATNGFEAPEAPETPETEAQETTPEPQTAPVTAPATSKQASSVEQAIRDLIEGVQKPPAAIDPETIREQVNAIAKEEVSKLVVPQNVTIKIDSREIKLENIRPHKTFTTLLDLMVSGENIYLFGDPGWGKSQAVSDAAKALGRDFGFTSLTLQTSDTRVTGFHDGHGHYHATPLRTLFESGGIFCVDEVDRANGNTLTALNNMLANGHGQFPDAKVTRHQDFVCCATGNTTGTGANLNFPDCRPLDAAFRDRFFFLEWGEDAAFERTIGLGINPKAGSWIDWIQNVRKFSKANNLRLVVSPRATYKGALHLNRSTLSVETLAEGVLWRGAARETVTRILQAHPYPQGGAQ